MGVMRLERGYRSDCAAQDADRTASRRASMLGVATPVLRLTLTPARAWPDSARRECWAAPRSSVAAATRLKPANQRAPIARRQSTIDHGEKIQCNRARMLSVLTLSTGVAFGAAAMAADMPKEGTYNDDYAASGTAQATAIGKGWF